MLPETAELTDAPEFVLPDSISGKELSLESIRSDSATVIMFICNHCPYVLHINDELVRIAKEYEPKGVSLVAISSNDIVNYPQDRPELMKEHAKNVGYTFPYLYDESQDVARAYDAACTPDPFLFDADLKCVYRGQLDESRPKNDIPVTGKDLRNALDALLADEPVSENQIPSIGCNIKWK